MSIALIVLAFAVWLIGGNVLLAFHYRRRGLPMWSGFKPFAFPVAHFVWFEWISLVLLAVGALAFLAIGIGVQESG